MTQLTTHQLSALRRIRTASGVWRHYVPSNGLGIHGTTWKRLRVLGLVEHRPHEGLLCRYEYRLTDAGRDELR